MMSVNSMRLFRLLVTVLLGGLVLVACAPKSAEDVASNAREAIQAGKLPEAVISLKQAIQAEPNSARFRALLGVALLKQNNFVAAEIEFRKALELKGDPSGVVPGLAEAMLGRGLAKNAIDEFGTAKINDLKAATDLALTLARAHAQLGERSAARAIVERVLASQPDLTPALLLKARLTAGTPEGQVAKTLLEGILARDPKNDAAWQLTGDIKLTGGADLPGALQAFRKVVEIKPQAATAHAAIVTILLHQRDLEGADRQLQAMKKSLGGNVETVYQEANVAFAKGDFKRAREASHGLLRVFPDSVRLLQLAGAAEIALGAAQQGETLLNKALSIDPDLPIARRLLAQTYLRSGQSAKALGVLRPLLQANVADGTALLMAGESYLVDGDIKSAEEYFKRAAAAAPANKQVQLALAINEFSKGRPDSGFSQLEALSVQGGDVAVDMALITFRMRMRQFDEALLAVESLAKKLPGKPNADGLRGRIYLSQGKRDEARKSFEQALVKDPLYFPVVASLAALDIAAKNPAAAKQRFEAVLKIDPKNVPAMLALADFAVREGQSKEEIVKMLTTAVQVNGGNPGTRLYLIDYLRSTRDFKGGLAAAQDALAQHPNNAEILAAVGGALVDNGEYMQALSILRKLASLEPKSAVPHMRMADAYLLSGDSKSAVKSLQRALELEPDLAPAQKNLIAVLRRLKQPKEALAVAKAIQLQRPADAGGFAFEGDIAVEAKDWPRAISAFKTGLGKRRGEGLSSRLYIALLRGASQAEADAFSRDWLKSHPDDTALLMQLGNTALSADDLPLAETHYREVAKLEPGNAMALNNVAWAVARQRKPGAVDLAERAVALQPGVPSYLDTLAYALAQEGNLAKAIDRQKQAVALAPGSPGLTFNLAKLELKAGNQAAAKAGLQKLLRPGVDLPLQEEARRLLQTLQ